MYSYPGCPICMTSKKHLLLKHKLRKHRLFALKHRLTKRSTSKNIDLPKDRLAKTSTDQKVDWQKHRLTKKSTDKD
jgi:hypothetical protein